MIYYLSTMSNDTYAIGVVGLDVVRTDQTLVFYESQTNQAKLWDVLAIYAWMDNDIGYIQGGLLSTSLFFCHYFSFEIRSLQ